MTASPELFAFPDGKGFLDSVDRVSGGLECFFSMHCGHCNDNADFTNLQFALSVDQSDRLDGPALPDLSLKFDDLALSHSAIDFVLETLHPLTVRLISDCSDEKHDAARIFIHYGFESLGRVNWFPANSRFQSYSSTHNRRKERDSVSFLQGSILLGDFFV